MRCAARIVLAFSAPGLVYAQADAGWQVYYPNNPNVMYPPVSATQTATAAATTQTIAAQNLTELTPPALPNPMPSLSFGVQLWSGGMTNLSISLNGAFMGFSVEMSVATQFLGKNSSAIYPVFLNLMANIAQRVGWVRIRVGGNSQETAELKTTLQGYPEGTILGKDTTNTTNPTNTPPIEYTPDLFYMLGNISDLVNVRWYLGVPFYTVDPVDMDIAVAGDAILGDRVLAYQVANEPDYYGFNGRDHRPNGYSPANFTTEFGEFIDQVNANSSITRRNNTWMVPSISATNWNIDDFITTGLISTYQQELYAMTVERYPSDNCAAVYNTGPAANAQEQLTQFYLSHSAVTSILSYYQTSSAYAVSLGVPYIMFETNTASCSGFPGVSDAFASALWGLDWAMTLAATNFSAALYHIGGQAAYYNAFTPPPTAQSAYYGWTVGPLYYAALVMAETLGPSNASQVVSTGQNYDNDYTPGWAVYENGTPKKVLMMNYMDGSSANGSADYVASISIGGNATGQAAATPSSVRVKYLNATSVVSKTGITWAGQTFGDHFASDGRPQGDLEVYTIPCDTISNVCLIPVPAPGVALVFLDDEAYNSVTPSSLAQTFPTTFYTATVNTAQINQTALASSNGHGNMKTVRGATSQNSRHNAAAARVGIGRASALLLAVGITTAAFGIVLV